MERYTWEHVWTHSTLKKTLYLEGSSSQRLGDGALSRANNLIKRKIFLIGVIAAGCVIAIAALIPSVANGQMDNIKTSMAALKTKTATLGAPKVEGSDPVASKDVPALYFGATKMNKNGGTATGRSVLWRSNYPGEALPHRLRSDQGRVGYCHWHLLCRLHEIAGT